MTLYWCSFMAWFIALALTLGYLIVRRPGPRQDSYQASCELDGCSFTIQIQSKNARYIGESMMDHHIDRHINEYVFGDNDKKEN